VSHANAHPERRDSVQRLPTTAVALCMPGPREIDDD